VETIFFALTEVSLRHVPMNAFSEFLFPENIFLGLHASNKVQAFAQIAELLERQHQIGRGLIYESLWEREQLGSTGLGRGVAIPHAQIKGLRHPMTAFVRLKLAIDFDAPDGQQVSELFVLLVPRDATIEHLQILADVTEILCGDQFREQISAATEPGAILRLFSDIANKQERHRS
jgi:PTS system nitrogen regulatory IIA component